jgi:DNA-binding NtrC family response regulator
MKKYGKILIIDDADQMLLGLRSIFNDHFNQIDCEKNPNLIPSYLSRIRYDMYILKMNFKCGRLNGNEGIYWMNRIFERHPGANVVLTTTNGSVETVVRAIKEGAIDIVQKPWNNSDIVDTVLSACKPFRADNRFAGKKAMDRRKPFAIQIIGNSEPMRRLLFQIDKVAATDANVLVTGENGTGKELVARAIHRQSKRAGETFVSVDMGSLTGSLFESELFGHKKGSFTDAQEDRPGRFEMADGGSLFLDEIGNLPLDLQAKLLSVLQNRQVVRVGTNTPVSVDIRLVSATNMPLDRIVREGKFREDLLYRLNTITIHVPALRERKNDIKALFLHFKEKYEER